MPAGVYAIMVSVRSQGSSAQFDIARTLNFSIVQTAPAGLGSFTANLASPQQRGAVVAFTAQGSGGGGTYEYKFQRKLSTGMIWSTVQNFSSSPTLTWDTGGATVGTYNVKVLVRNQGSAASYEAQGIISYSVVGAMPATGATMMSDLATPRQPGEQVTFSAQGKGGTGVYEYQFLLRYPSSTVWTVVQDYGSSNQWAWNTANTTLGTYTMKVNVRNNGSAALYEAVASMNYSITLDAPATGATLTSDLPSPRQAGQTVTFTAQGQGGSGVYEYQFVRRLPSSTVWSVVQEYGSSNTWIWNTTGTTAGTYTIRVNVRNSGSVAQYEALASQSYAVTDAAPATGATLTTNMASPQVTGATVPFTAQGTGGSGAYEYLFQYKLNTGPTWTTSQGYSTNATWNWETTGAAAGVYTVKVQVRSQGSSLAYEATKTLSFTVLSSAPVTGVTLVAMPVKTAQVGTSVTFMAQASGGSGSYEYQFYRTDPGSTAWTPVQDYSSSPNLVWDTTGQAAGTYTLMVYARSAGSPLAYEAFKVLSFTLTAP